MKKLISLILILTTILFALTGCTRLNGIDEYYYIISLGIDRGETSLLKLSILTTIMRTK